MSCYILQYYQQMSQKAKCDTFYSFIISLFLTFYMKQKYTVQQSQNEYFCSSCNVNFVQFIRTSFFSISLHNHQECYKVSLGESNMNVHKYSYIKKTGLISFPPFLPKRNV